MENSEKKKVKFFFFFFDPLNHPEKSKKIVKISAETPFERPETKFTEEKRGYFSPKIFEILQKVQFFAHFSGFLQNFEKMGFLRSKI